MKTRRRSSNRVDAEPVVRITTIPIDATPMVTLDDPTEPPVRAVGAFARLRPPEGMTAAEIDSWRIHVAKHARAVKVLPAPRAADVPGEAQRVDEDEIVGTIREEAVAMAKETKNPDVLKLVTKILDEVGA